MTPSPSPASTLSQPRTRAHSRRPSLLRPRALARRPPGSCATRRGATQPTCTCMRCAMHVPKSGPVPCTCTCACAWTCACACACLACACACLARSGGAQPDRQRVRIARRAPRQLRRAAARALPGAHCMCMCMCTAACAPHAHCMCTACTLHCMCTACALHVHHAHTALQPTCSRGRVSRGTTTRCRLVPFLTTGANVPPPASST